MKSLFFPVKDWTKLYNVPDILLTESKVPPTTPFNKPATPFAIPFPNWLGPFNKPFLGSFTNSKNPVPIFYTNWTGLPIISELPNIVKIWNIDSLI